MENYKLDELAKKLYEDINNDDDIFNTTLIIVPSNKIGSYLKSYFLKDNKDSSILMNVKIQTLRNTIIELFDNIEIADRTIIRSLIIQYLSNNKISALNDYFSNSKTKSTNIYSVADKLSSAFQNYDDNLIDVNDFKDDNLYEKDIYNFVIEKLKSNNLFTLSMINNDNLTERVDAYLFGFVKYTKLEESLINKYLNVISKYDLKINTLDKNIIKSKITNIIKAPSKTREIEALHSDICRRLAEDSSCSFNDFLVISNNIADYNVEINRVFNQNNEGYPFIPFYIGGSNPISNETNYILNLLFKIGNNKYFTRKDFIDILDNWITKKINDLADEDVLIIKRSIIDLYVYRQKEDWEYLIKRLELSKICDINDEMIISN